MNNEFFVGDISLATFQMLKMTGEREIILAGFLKGNFFGFG